MDTSAEHTPNPPRHPATQPPFMLCRPGILIVALAYTAILLGSLLVCIVHRDPLYLLSVGGYTALAALLLYKVYKMWGKGNGRRLRKRGRRADDS